MIPSCFDANCLRSNEHHALFICFFRRHSVQAEGLPGLHSLSAAERRHPGPGGESEDHPRGSGRMSGTLQQLRLPLPEPGPLRGENQQLLLRLWPVRLHWSLLRQRFVTDLPAAPWCHHGAALPNVSCDLLMTKRTNEGVANLKRVLY